MLKLRRKIATLSLEAIGNLILLVSLICAFTTTVVCAILGEVHFFYLDLNHNIEITVILVLFIAIGSAVFLFFKSKWDILSKNWFKYYLLAVMFSWLMINCSIVFFHSTLLILFPIFIAFCYNSERIMRLCIAGTLMLIIFTPIIAYGIGGMDISFPIWYLTVLYPDAISTSGYEYWYSHNGFSDNLLNLPSHIQILIWVVLPRLMVVISLIVISVAGTFVNRKVHEKQIRKILGLQDSIIDSMSEVIENRDTSTGGHVKRTQNVVRILVNEMKKEMNKTDKYWRDVIKSAVVHDLGKIAISDVILNKPGKLTVDEFSEIKKHPVKSKSIIETIMLKNEDEEFQNIAENMALYHHEKYDGSGYPEGLKGDDIPLEARIMAVADVYDALVSERCYKKPYSSEEAYIIIKESMGTHFDPGLWSAFDRAYPKLEAYYR